MITPTPPIKKIDDSPTNNASTKIQNAYRNKKAKALLEEQKGRKEIEKMLKNDATIKIQNAIRNKNAKVILQEEKRIKKEGILPEKSPLDYLQEAKANKLTGVYKSHLERRRMAAMIAPEIETKIKHYRDKKSDINTRGTQSKEEKEKLMKGLDIQKVALKKVRSNIGIIKAKSGRPKKEITV
jgi:hypothetical protein